MLRLAHIFHKNLLAAVPSEKKKKKKGDIFITTYISIWEYGKGGNVSTHCRKTQSGCKPEMTKNQIYFPCLTEAPKIQPKILHFFLIENIAIYRRGHKFCSHSWMGSP